MSEVLQSAPTIWLTRKEAARYLTSIGCPITYRSLEQMSRKNNLGKGPAFYRTGWHTVRYKKADLDAWAEKKMERVE